MNSRGDRTDILRLGKKRSRLIVTLSGTEQENGRKFSTLRKKRFVTVSEIAEMNGRRFYSVHTLRKKRFVTLQLEKKRSQFVTVSEIAEKKRTDGYFAVCRHNEKNSVCHGATDRTRERTEILQCRHTEKNPICHAVAEKEKVTFVTLRRRERTEILQSVLI